MIPDNSEEHLEFPYQMTYFSSFQVPPVHIWVKCILTNYILIDTEEC